MLENFNIKKLENDFNLNTITPNNFEQNQINDIIFNELTKDIINKRSKQIYLGNINILLKQCAQGVILVWTEIGLLVKDYKIKLFDTTIIHSKFAANLSIK